MDARERVNEYDLGLPVPLAPLEERRGRIPQPVWERLQRFCAVVRDVLGSELREIRLFGSYARGQFDDESDVDVLAVADVVTTEQRNAIIDAAVLAAPGRPSLSPLVLTMAQLEQLRARELILATDLDREGIPL